MAEQLAPEPAPAYQPERRFIAMLAWTQKHRRFLAEGVPFDLAGHRYLAGIYKDASRELVIMKSGQGGASEYCISRALWCCDVRQMNVLYLLPTISDISDFSQMRIGTALEASAYLASIVVPGREEKKRGGDRVQLKRIRDRWLVLRGAQVRAGQSSDGGPRSGASRLKSVPVDLVIYDEFDEMPAGVEALAVKRLGHSAHKEQVWVSTPTYPGTGIHDKYLQSDQRRWEVQCWSCNTWQPLTIDHVVVEQDDLGRPTAWHGQDEGRAYCACQKCGAELDRLANGQWVPQNPGAAITGYSFNKLATAQNDPLSVVMALQTTDESKRQEAFNQDLALPYKPRGGGLDASTLDACQRDYSFSSAFAIGETSVMGVDVGRVLHVVVRSLDQGTGRHLRWAGEVMSFEEAAAIAKRFHVSRIVMDALPETRKAREFQAMFPARVCWLAYYSDGGKAGEPSDWKEERGADGWLGTVTVDRTRTLDETIHRFIAGENTLPGHIRSLPRYYEQLQSPVRVVQRQPNGVEVARYVETGPDHFCFVAGTMIETSDGPMPIEQVPVGASVLTRAGYCRVSMAGLTEPAADVRRYIFSDGSSLTATPSHPVYVQGAGFVALNALTMVSAIVTAEQRTVRFVRSVAAGKAAVYNLTVDGGMPEYYANGILVHNCHAENYATVASFEAKRSAGTFGRR